MKRNNFLKEICTRIVILDDVEVTPINEKLGLRESEQKNVISHRDYPDLIQKNYSTE
jgi:hypothetical protein